MSDSLWPRGLQNARLPCPSPGIYSSSCPLSQWCHPTTSCSVIPFSSCPQSFSASDSFQMSQFFASSGQSIGVSASASSFQWIFKTYLNKSRMDWLDLPAAQGTLKSLLQHHRSKASILRHSAFLIVQLSHPYMTTRKTIVLTRWTFVDKGMSLLFNMLSRLVIPLKGCCWTVRRQDSWPPEETNSILGQRRGWIAQSFCVIKFY